MVAKRRGNGEGTICHRKDGRWCAAVFVGIVNSKPKRKFIYGRTRKEVSEKLKAVLHAQQQGLNIAPERMTVAQFLDLWLEQVVKVRNRPRTFDSYRHTVRTYLIPRLGQHQLTRLTPAHVQQMLADMLRDGLTRTVPYARSVLIIALGVAVKWGYVARNVAVLVDSPSVDRRDIQPLEWAQVQTLLDAVRGTRLEALYLTAMMLGLRRGEVLGLRWEDVDLDAATVRITGALQRLHGQLERTATKTKSSNRTLSLPTVLAGALQTHRAQQDGERQGADWQEHGLVFTTSRGTPIEPGTLNRHFRGVLKRAGLPLTTRFHDLRHSCATFMLLQGVPLKVISKILGHTQLSTTADIYTHVLPDLERDAADRMDGLFAPPSQATENQGDTAGEGSEDVEAKNDSNG